MRFNKPGVRLKYAGRRYVDFLRNKKHIAEAISFTTFVTPIGAGIEKLASMSDLKSAKTRAITAGVLYLGWSEVVKLRDWSKIKVGITKESNWVPKYLFDGAFALASTSIIRPIIYLAAGETDWGKIAFSSFSIMAASLALGGPLLHFIDIYRDFTGVRETERLPEFIKRLPPKAKKSLAVASTAVAIATTSMIYYFTPSDSEEAAYIEPAAQQMVVGDNRNHNSLLEDKAMGAAQ